MVDMLGIHPSTDEEAAKTRERRTSHIMYARTEVEIGTHGKYMVGALTAVLYNNY
jgi:hypothetical protein